MLKYTQATGGKETGSGSFAARAQSAGDKNTSAFSANQAGQGNQGGQGGQGGQKGSGSKGN